MKFHYFVQAVGKTKTLKIDLDITNTLSFNCQQVLLFYIKYKMLPSIWIEILM